ncbi:EamA family transporter [Candidatus Woesearchaeota archaeon]|nr:EamA family transporter [Candidatus Woesearchaeota archaeon]
MSLLFGIGLVVVGTLIGAYGALFLKFASGKISLNPLKLIKNHWLIFGVVLYGISTIPCIIALRYGPVSVMYPFVSLSYIWVILLSIIHLKEKMNVYKYLGVTSIIMGVTLIGAGA